MEGLPLVCYSTGTMNSLLDKLTKLKNNHSNPPDQFSVLAENLKEDLLGLKEEFCDKPGVSKVCMKQVRELVFEIEDWIDQRPETNMLDPSDTEEIKYFMSEIKEARERFKWYDNVLKIEPSEPDLAIVAPSKITINPRLLVEEKYCRGLLDGPRDELVKHLTDQAEEMLKVVSVVGVEGLGKTTLAKEIYSELQLRRLFECQAFVSVGRKPAMREILTNILCQVKRTRDFTVMDEQEIITELREYLDTKRYFILVDGIGGTLDWNIINCALPNNRGSRVLVTTCNTDVGKSCSIYPSDIVYHMDALSEKNSKIFFLSRIITLQDEERGAEFEEVSGKMLNLSTGMPLAIIVAAGFLARKSKELAELKTLGESIYSRLKQYSSSEGMAMILHMSFADLSLPLRSCFLYLGVFPEDHTIKKDRLIRLWGAEGFISRTDKECLWVTGDRYFNELISRRLIQPVFGFGDDQAVGCTIHGVILDFIRSLSREENFATTAVELSSGPFLCDTIRRFSVDYRNEDEADTFSRSTVHLSSMRSLTVFGDVEGMFDPLPPSDSEDDEKFKVPLVNILWSFKLLRVLDLEDRKELKDHHLEGIGGLVLLRYLGLAGTRIRGLPEEIGELEQLETLDLRQNCYFGTTLPASIFKLQKLKHLLLDGNVERSWVMQELEEANIRANGSDSLITVAELLRKSEWLRRLEVTLSRSCIIQAATNLMSFFDEVVKSKLLSLSLNCEFLDEEEVSLLVDSWAKVTAPPVNKFGPPRFKLVLLGLPLWRVPPNMGSLSSLTHLNIRLQQAKAEDFHVLGGLNNLVLLELFAIHCSLEGRFVIKKGIFPCLKVFSFIILYSWMGLEFEEGAMPQLQRLARTLRVRDRFEYPDIGIEHLTCLTTVHVSVSCAYATYSQVDAAEAAIRAQISEPTLVLSRSDETLMKDEGQHSLELNEEDEDQMWKDERQHSLDRRTEDEGKMWKSEGEQYSIPSKRQAWEKMRKSILQLGKVSEDKMKKDKGQQFINPGKLSEKTGKHKFGRSPVSKGKMKEDKGQQFIDLGKLSEKTEVFELSPESEDKMKKDRGVQLGRTMESL